MTIVARRAALVCWCGAAILNCSGPENLFDDSSFAGAAGTSNVAGTNSGAPPGGTSDGGTSDSGASEAGTSEGGTSDGGASDGGEAGASEGGTLNGGSASGGPSIGGAAIAGAGIGGGAGNAGGGSANAGGGSANVEGGSANAGGGSANAGGGSANVEGGSANAGGGSANAGGGNANVEGGSANAGGGSANARGGSANAGSSGVVAPTITLLNPTTLVRGYSALFVMGTDLSGASLTIGGKSQLVTSSSEPQLVVTPINVDSPLGSQPVVASNAAGASAPAYVEVLSRLKLDSASAESATRVKVTFNRALNSASVSGARFTIPGLTIGNASNVGAIVTLTTSQQTSSASYTVSASALVVDLYGSPVAAEGVSFTGSN